MELKATLELLESVLARDMNPFNGIERAYRTLGFTSLLALESIQWN
jgi:hypothetical protein